MIDNSNLNRKEIPKEVPVGTFFGLLDVFFGSSDSPSIGDPIAQFERDAPYARYMGNQNGEQTWIESVTDPITGITVTLAYTTSDHGKNAEAYAIDPDMRGHDLGQENIHCYHDGRLCTDLPGVKRTLPEKRARAVLWVSGFANFLKEGRFAVDE